MSLEGIPGMTANTRAFVQMVRKYMRDHPELNRIVSGEESSDRQVAWGIFDALSLFNGSPPITNASLDELLGRNQHALLLRLTVQSLLESIAMLQLRNHLNYSNGGINVGVNDKSPMILSWLQYYRSFTNQLMMRVKVAMNIEGILGPSNTGIHSELWAVNATYAAY